MERVRGLTDTDIKSTIVITSDNDVASEARGVSVRTTTSTAERLQLLLHPHRLRIGQLLAPGRRLTARQIGRAAPDIPPATLYRHLNQLVEGGILAVVEERQVRNMTERVYALAEANNLLDPESSVEATKDDLLRVFTAFAALLLGDFQRYLANAPGERADFRREGVNFWQQKVALTVEEAWQLSAMLDAALASFRERPEDPARRQHLVSFAMMPATDEPTDDPAGP